MTDNVTSGLKGSTKNVMAWAKKNPVIVVALLAGVALLAYVSSKSKGLDFAQTDSGFGVGEELLGGGGGGEFDRDEEVVGLLQRIIQQLGDVVPAPLAPPTATNIISPPTRPDERFTRTFTTPTFTTPTGVIYPSYEEQYQLPTGELSRIDYLIENAVSDPAGAAAGRAFRERQIREGKAVTSTLAPTLTLKPAPIPSPIRTPEPEKKSQVDRWLDVAKTPRESQVDRWLNVVSPTPVIVPRPTESQVDRWLAVAQAPKESQVDRWLDVALAAPAPKPAVRKSQVDRFRDVIVPKPAPKRTVRKSQVDRWLNVAMPVPKPQARPAPKRKTQITRRTLPTPKPVRKPVIRPESVRAGMRR